MNLDPDEWQCLIERLRRTLDEAAELFRTYVCRQDCDGSCLPAWIRLEHEAMLYAINEERQRRSLSPIDISDVDGAGLCACALPDGHWRDRFVRFCAELAVGTRRIA